MGPRESSGELVVSAVLPDLVAQVDAATALGRVFEIPAALAVRQVVGWIREHEPRLHQNDSRELPVDLGAACPDEFLGRHTFGIRLSHRVFGPVEVVPIR